MMLDLCNILKTQIFITSKYKKNYLGRLLIIIIIIIIVIIIVLLLLELLISQ